VQEIGIQFQQSAQPKALVISSIEYEYGHIPRNEFKVIQITWNTHVLGRSLNEWWTHYGIAKMAVNDLLTGLVLVSNKMRPLVGGTVEGVSFYEHIATVYHRPTNQFFVAYQTSKVPLTFHALWAEAEGLRDGRGTVLERRFANETHRLYIERVTKGRKRCEVIRRIDDWLEAIEDYVEFVTVVRFLIGHKILDGETLGKP
jgi:hypothetical protein